MVINFTPIQVSPSLLPPRSALDVLPQSLSAYPGSSTFFNQVIITVLSAPMLSFLITIMPFH